MSLMRKSYDMSHPPLSPPAYGFVTCHNVTCHTSPFCWASPPALPPPLPRLRHWPVLAPPRLNKLVPILLGLLYCAGERVVERLRVDRRISLQCCSKVLLVLFLCSQPPLPSASPCWRVWWRSSTSTWTLALAVFPCTASAVQSANGVFSKGVPLVAFMGSVHAIWGACARLLCQFVWPVCDGMCLGHIAHLVCAFVGGHMLLELRL